jgi:hypothetical protein
MAATAKEELNPLVENAWRRWPTRAHGAERNEFVLPRLFAACLAAHGLTARPVQRDHRSYDIQRELAGRREVTFEVPGFAPRWSKLLSADRQSASRFFGAAPRSDAP